MTTRTVDAGIVVVGAGPTGLTLACELHRLGVPCRVIDQGSGPTTVTRALGMFTRSLEVLDDFGAADEAIARGQRLEIANIFAGRRRIGGFRADSLTGTQRPVILALPQYETEALLQDRLERLGGTVERNTALRDLRQEPGGDRVSLTVDGQRGEETVEAGWVVGADGAHSTVRKSVGIEFAGEATKDVFVIVDARLDPGPPAGEVNYYFSREGVTVVSPLPDGTYRIAAAMSDFIGDGSPVSLDIVQTLLDRRVGRGVRLRELRDAGWGAAQVRVHTRLAETFRKGRCVLAGDASHIYSPIGGQGMNGGIQDAHNLAWKLALVGTDRASDELLDSYAHERRAVAQDALRITAAQMRLGGLRSRAGVALRDALVSRLSKAGMLDRYMAPTSVMLRIRYSANPGVVANGRRGPQGKRIPDLPLGGGDGGSTMLFSLLREQPLTLLALGATDADSARIDGLVEQAAARYDGVVAVHRIADGNGARGGGRSRALVDRGGRLHRELRVKEPSVCLVRGDGHIAYFGPLGAAPSLVGYLDAMLSPSRSTVSETAG